MAVIGSDKIADVTEGRTANGCCSNSSSGVINMSADGSHNHGVTKSQDNVIRTHNNDDTYRVIDKRDNHNRFLFLHMPFADM